MRDTRKDKAYFDAFIAEENEAVSDFEQSIQSGEITPDTVPSVRDEILMIKTGVLIARYSRGDDIDELCGMLTEMTDDFCKWWESDAYTDNIRFASMAYLFGTEEKVLEKIRKNMIGKNEGKTYDRLIDFILTGNVSSGKLAWEKPYHLLAQAIDESSAEPLKTYLSRWYSAHRDCEWYDTHKIRDDMLYCGYWCFEAAAVAKRLGLDDTALRQSKYYPADLIQ